MINFPVNWFLFKVLLVLIPLGCATACSAPGVNPSKNELVGYRSQSAEDYEHQSRFIEPTQRDVKAVEDRITKLLINRLFEQAESEKKDSVIEEIVNSELLSVNGDPRLFLELKVYRKHLVEMLKKGCIDDAYKRWDSSSRGSNYRVIERLELLKAFANATIWKVKDKQYLISFTCGHGMSLSVKAVFLLEITGNGAEVKPLRLIEVSRDNRTKEFRFRPAWDTLVFGAIGLSFDEKTKIVSITTKGNGSGQIKSSWKYKIKGNNFVLVEYRHRGWDYKGSDVPRIYP